MASKPIIEQYNEALVALNAEQDKARERIFTILESYSEDLAEMATLRDTACVPGSIIQQQINNVITAIANVKDQFRTAKAVNGVVNVPLGAPVPAQVITS